MYTTLTTVSALAALSAALPADKAARFVPCTYDQVDAPANFVIDFFHANGTGPVPLDYFSPLGNTPPTLYNAPLTSAAASFSYTTYGQLSHTTGGPAIPATNEALVPGEAIAFAEKDTTGRGSIYVRRGSEGCASTADVLVDTLGPLDSSLSDPTAVWGLCQIPGITIGQQQIEYLGPKGQAKSGCEAGTLRISAATAPKNADGTLNVA